MTFGELRFQLAKLCPGTDADILDGAINDAYSSILNRTAWKALEADDKITTVAVYETGTVALTAGSLVVVGTGTVWTAAMTGRGFYVSGRNETYRFTYTDATHAALDRAYEGDASATASYKIYQDIYTLPDDFESGIVARNERLPQELVFWDRATLDRMAPNRIQFGEPEVYSLVTPGPILPAQASEENDRQRAQLYPIPSYAAGYPFSYCRRIPTLEEGDTETPLLPWVSVQAIKDLARFFITGDARFSVTARFEISSMLQSDARRKGPQKIRMAAKYTRHRLERAIRGAGGSTRELP